MPQQHNKTKWAARSAAHRPAEGRPVVIFVLMGYFLTLLPYQLSRQIVYSFPAKCKRKSLFPYQIEITTISLLGCTYIVNGAPWPHLGALPFQLPIASGGRLRRAQLSSVTVLR